MALSIDQIASRVESLQYRASERDARAGDVLAVYKNLNKITIFSVVEKTKFPLKYSISQTKRIELWSDGQDTYRIVSQLS